MGLRDRALEAAAELAAAEREYSERAAANRAAAAARPAPRNWQKEYLQQLLRTRLARWCTEMGIDPPTPKFTVDTSEGSLSYGKMTLNGPQAPYYHAMFRFSVEGLNFKGEYWASGFRSARALSEEELRRPPDSETLRICLSSRHPHLEKYEINDLAGLAAALNADRGPPRRGLP
jgi:hypothetical protein